MAEPVDAADLKSATARCAGSSPAPGTNRRTRDAGQGSAALAQAILGAMSQLSIDDLCLWRGDRRLVDGLSFALEAGTALWLRGENGAGKTSLLRALAGLARPERGA